MSQTQTKAEYYKIRAIDYPLNDPEALIRYQRAIRWMDVRDNLTVREVGCKFAILRDLLEKEALNADYKALDIDLATLKRIERYNPEQFLLHDVSSGLPFESNSTDYLFCLEVMEHLENPSAFLVEARRVLRDNGKLILSVPNPYCWIEVVQNIKRRPDTEGHISSFTGQNIDALLKFAGLKLSAKMGTYTHVPLSKRILGKYWTLPADNMLLTRSFLYLIEKQNFSL